MSDAYAFGQMAEKKAALYFRKKGFRVLAKNYRYRKAEIDLIVQKNDQLVAVEVKARSSKSFGAPYSFVSSKKNQLDDYGNGCVCPFEKIRSRPTFRYYELYTSRWKMAFGTS